jgi:hypothetical protein
MSMNESPSLNLNNRFEKIGNGISWRILGDSWDVSSAWRFHA